MSIDYVRDTTVKLSNTEAYSISEIVAFVEIDIVVPENKIKDDKRNIICPHDSKEIDFLG